MILCINLFDFLSILCNNIILYFQFLFLINSNNLNGTIFYIYRIIYIVNLDLMVYYIYTPSPIFQKEGRIYF